MLAIAKALPAMGAETSARLAAALAYPSKANAPSQRAELLARRDSLLDLAGAAA